MSDIPNLVASSRAERIEVLRSLSSDAERGGGDSIKANRTKRILFDEKHLKYRTEISYL